MGTVCWLVFAGFGLAQRGRKYVPPPPTANIKVTVLRSTDGKPVNDASVIFHPIKNGKDEGAMELKSDDEGVVKIDVIPVGDTIRLQVIADGWRTYGEDYNIDGAKKEIVVKLQRPRTQASDFQGGDTAPPIDESTPQSQSGAAKPNGQVPLPK